jgi:hypothetical protein
MHGVLRRLRDRHTEGGPSGDEVDGSPTPVNARGRARGSRPGHGAIGRLTAPWAIFVGIRLAFLLFTALTLLWLPVHGNRSSRFPAWGGISDLVFGAFGQWDANLFLRIARDGYTSTLAAFMPAYPGVVHVLGPLTGSDLVAGVAISLVAGAIGVQLIHVLTRDVLGADVARDTTLLLALYPISYVFTAPYSEGLFLAAAAGAAVCGMRGRYWRAGFLAGVAVDTRLLGLALVPMLLVLAWPDARVRGMRLLAPILVLPAASLGLVAALFQHEIGDSLGFLHAQGGWGRHVGPLGPLGGAWRSARAALHGVGTLAGLPSDQTVASTAAQNVLDFGLLVAAVALTVVVYRRVGVAWAVYSTFVIAIAIAAPVTGGIEVLASFARLLLCDFPLFVAGASLLQGSPARRGVAFGVLSGLGAVTCVAFSRKVWIA